MANKSSRREINYLFLQDIAMAEQEQRCSLTKHMELARVALSTIQGHMQVKSIPWAKASNIHDFS